MNYDQALQILGLAHSPSSSEVKNAFRTLALKYHPDRNPKNPDAVREFQRSAEAYEFLATHPLLWQAQKPSQADEPKAPPVIENLEDIFDDIFGFSRGDRILGFQKVQEIELSLVQFAYGGHFQKKLLAYEKCASCQGIGSATGGRASLCTHCFGSGHIRVGSTDIPTLKLCPRCEGRGRKIKNPCFACQGFGRLSHYSWQEIRIPAGWAAKETYTVHAHDRKTGRATDVFVKPHLRAHPIFKMEGFDLTCEFPVGESLASKGGVAHFPSLWGWCSVFISAYQNQTNPVVLKGYGLPQGAMIDQRGDVYLALRWVSEKKSKKEQRRFFEAVAEGNPAYGNFKRSWWKRLISFFSFQF